MFKKSKLKGNIRKRDSSSNDQDEYVLNDTDSAVQTAVKRPREEQEASTSKSANTDKKDPHLETVTHKPSGKVGSLLQKDKLVTSSAQIDTDESTDRLTQVQRSEQIQRQLSSQADDGKYKGLDSYTSGIASKSSKLKIGPMRASANIRVTSRMDYQPDVCKDYKMTGYCGYGDSCKFLHDREDYKQGWQIDKEWDEMVLNKKQQELDERNGDGPVGTEADNKEMPFACLICKLAFTKPVVTKCGHYCCEACAIKHHRKSQNCFACGKSTHGIFTVAKDMIARQKLLERK